MADIEEFYKSSDRVPVPFLEINFSARRPISYAFGNFPQWLRLRSKDVAVNEESLLAGLC